ncbi:putative ripening-related protein 2 [Trifolium pratense]|uniref:Uncharacterized protein n=1 Tax=Trifolium pratense TaxID=57577 RepID=A0ACB0KN37_TRIPR|nr:putative ripening-related protein 2 [Trifolium pratense]CAJ2657822.1 unnamed protein product [Trifolium pratense]
MKGVKISSNTIKTIIFLLIIVSTFCISIEASTHKGRVRGKNLKSNSCKPGKTHTTCSPKVTKHTKATLTLNNFEKGGDGGSASECDGKFHSDNTLVVALSTGWLKSDKKRCLKKINIFGNGKRVKALVVDECDSTRGCLNNIVDASSAVWKALGVPQKDRGEMEIFWSDA